MSEKPKASANVHVEEGLHARAASTFVQKAAKFKCDIFVIIDDTSINAKSIMGILSGGIAKGSDIIIEAEGEDAEEAVKALKELFDTNFGEDL